MRVNLLTKRTRRTLLAIGVMMLSALAYSETSREVSAQHTRTPNGGNCGVFQVNEYCFCTGGYIYCYYPEEPEPEPDREPLIFVPGIGGSNLRVEGGSALWFSLLESNLNRLTLDPLKPQENIIATDATRGVTYNNPLTGGVLFRKIVYEPLLQTLVGSGYYEYQVNRDPARQTTAGCDMTQDSENSNQKPNLFVFAYDWRKNNVEGAAALKDYVGCVRKFYPSSKINIVAHSMGGLLARRYILDNPGAHNVDKLITIGSPWLGAPKAIYMMETGEFFGNLLDRAHAPTMKSLVEFFPGVHELLPSRNYFALGGRPFGEGVVTSFFNRGGVAWDINGDGKTSTEYTFNQLTSLLDTKQFARSKPMQASNLFHTAAQDDWRADSSGVEYHHIFGVQKNSLTVGKVIATKKPKQNSQGQRVYADEYEREFVIGDGTVPIISAERKASGVNLNSPKAKMIPFTATSSAENARVEHITLTQNPKVWDAILSALQAKPQQAAARHQSTSKSFMQKVSFGQQQNVTQEQDGPTQVELSENYDFKLSGIDNLLITDAQGNSNSQIEGTPFRRRLDDVDVYSSGENAYQIVLPTEMSPEQSFTLTFRSINEPIWIDLVKNKGSYETATLAIRYRDINLPVGTAMMLRVTSERIEDLRYDSGGDGTFETVVEPTASVEGDLAKDVAGPVVTFSEKVQGTKRLVTVITEDEAGVKSVRYSLDDRNYQPYTQPLLLDPTQNPAIYIIADDNLANRAFNTYRPLALTTQITRDASTNEIIVTATVRNEGDTHLADVITNFTLNVAKLNNKPTISALPVTINSVPSGETATVTLRFPATAAKPNTRATLFGSGTSHGQAFSGGLQVTVP